MLGLVIISMWWFGCSFRLLGLKGCLCIVLIIGWWLCLMCRYGVVFSLGCD